MADQLHRKRQAGTARELIPRRRTKGAWAVAPALTALLVFVPITGCETAKRLAPPGFVKYEDIAKDIPPNPVISQRIEELGIDGKARTGAKNDAATANEKPRYPKLADRPQTVPAGISTQAREAEIARLIRRRGEIEEALAAMQADAAAIKSSAAGRANAGAGSSVSEQSSDDRSLNARAAALQAEIRAERAAIAAERNAPLPAPLDTSKAPPPEEPRD